MLEIEHGLILFDNYETQTTSVPALTSERLHQAGT